MNTRSIIEPFCDAPKHELKALSSVALDQLPARARENMTHFEAHGFLGEEIPRDQETKRVSSECSTQVALFESYKPQKQEQTPDDATARQLLLSELGKPAYDTWLSPCRILFSGNGTAILLTPSAFSRNLLVKRYGKSIKRTLTTLMGQKIDLQIRVDESLEQVKTAPVPDRNDPIPDAQAKDGGSLSTGARALQEASLLLEQHGNIMDVIDHSPFFRKVIAPLQEGGWGIYPQSLTNACKIQSREGDLTTGLAAVIHAVRYTAGYRAARSKARFFWAALRNGTRQEA